MSSGPQLVVQMSSDEARLYQGMQKIIEQQRRMEEGWGKVGRSAKKAEADSMNIDSMIQSGVGSLAQMVTGWALVQSATKAAADIVTFHRDEVDKSIESVNKLSDATRKLAQISMSAKNLDEMSQQAAALSRTSGRPQADTSNLVFKANSEGFNDPKLLENMAATNAVVDMNTQADIASQAVQHFKGQITPAQMIRATLTAASSSKLDTEQISGSLDRSAKGAGLLGMAPEELLAGVSTVANRFEGKGSEANTAIGNMLTKASLHPELSKEKTWAGIMKRLENEGTRDDFLKEDISMRTAYGLLKQEMPAVSKRRQEIGEAVRTTGTADDILQKRLGYATSPETATGRQTSARITSEQTAQMKQQALQGRFGEEGLREKAAYDATMTSMLTNPKSTAAARALTQAQFGLLSLGPAEWSERAAVEQMTFDKGMRTTGNYQQSMDAAHATANLSDPEVKSLLRELIEEVKNIKANGAEAAAELRGAASELKNGAQAAGGAQQRMGQSFAEARQ